MTEQLSTKQRLAQAIQGRSLGNFDPRVDRLIRLALAGYYDDYESDLATPTTVLINDLRTVGFDDLAERVMDGEFDGTLEEATAWMDREGWKILRDELFGRSHASQ